MSPTVHARELQYTFPSGFTAGPLDLKVDRGLVQLTGPNGSGKTTLLRCLCGALRRSSGALQICGHDPRTDPLGRKQIAFVASKPELPDFLTVDEAWQQLAAIRGVDNWSGAPLREAVGLSGALPLAHASAGQRKLAEIIAGTAGEPQVLLLDEPWTNLDVDHARTLNRLLEGWREARVVVFTHHGAVPVAPDQVIALG